MALVSMLGPCQYLYTFYKEASLFPLCDVLTQSTFLCRNKQCIVPMVFGRGWS